MRANKMCLPSPLTTYQYDGFQTEIYNFVLNKCKVNSSFQYLTSRIIIIYDMNFVKGVQIT